MWLTDISEYLSHCLSSRCENGFPENSSCSRRPQRCRHNMRMDAIDKLVDESHQLEGIGAETLGLENLKCLEMF